MMHALRLESAKWFKTMQVAASNHLAYKLNFLLLVIGPTLVFFFVKFNLWHAIFSLSGKGVVQGYDLKGMLRYQGWVLVVSLLAQGYNSMNLAEDIRMGRISSYLIYPFQFWQFHLASFLGFQVIQIVLASLTLLALGLSGLILPLTPSALASGILLSALVGAFWFATSFVIGLISFWLEETWVLRVMLLTISQFLSGAILPLELYPEWMVRLLAWTPFPYMTYAPVKIMAGEYGGSIGTAALTLFVWLLIVGALGSALWRRGLKLYTAAGM